MGVKTQGTFKKGDQRAGRPKGVGNKKTEEARELFVQTLEGQVSHIYDAFEEVRLKDPARYLDLFAKYAMYFVPKKVDLTSDNEKVTITVNVK
jgi:hypothetical protein